MILLNKDTASQSIICTLNEKKTIASPFYLFVFKHVTTKEQIKFIADSNDDQSPFQDRYNEFIIATSTVFADSTPGQWNYFVYEQESSTNENPAGLTEVEMGKMELTSNTQFNFNGYAGTTSYRGYTGQ